MSLGRLFPCDCLNHSSECVLLLDQGFNLCNEAPAEAILSDRPFAIMSCNLVVHLFFQNWNKLILYRTVV